MRALEEPPLQVRLVPASREDGTSGATVEARSGPLSQHQYPSDDCSTMLPASSTFCAGRTDYGSRHRETAPAAERSASLADTILLKTEAPSQHHIDRATQTAWVRSGLLLAGGSGNSRAPRPGCFLPVSRTWGCGSHRLHAEQRDELLTRKQRLATGRNVTGAEDHDRDGDLQQIVSVSPSASCSAVRGSSRTSPASTAGSSSPPLPLATSTRGWLDLAEIEDAARILRAWRDWLPERAGPSLASCAQLLQLPPLPQVPEPFRGRYGSSSRRPFFVWQYKTATAVARSTSRARAGTRHIRLDAAGADWATSSQPDSPTAAIRNDMLINTLPVSVVDELMTTMASVPGHRFSHGIRAQPAARSATSRPTRSMHHARPEFALLALGVPVEPRAARSDAPAADQPDRGDIRRYLYTTAASTSPNAEFNGFSDLRRRVLERAPARRGTTRPRDLFRAQPSDGTGFGRALKGGLP